MGDDEQTFYTTRFARGVTRQNKHPFIVAQRVPYRIKRRPGPKKGHRQQRSKILGIVYPLALVEKWNRVHRNREHTTWVVETYRKVYPTRPDTIDLTFMEKEIRRRGYDCNCKGRMKVARLAREWGLYAYYL
jgi:hypothetical protein